MSEMSFDRKVNNKPNWPLTLFVIVLIAAAAVAALAFSGVLDGAPAVENSPETPQALWESQEVNSYRYTLQVSCFCIVEVTRPVTIEIQNGEVASITYVEDGTAADPQLFELYNSIDKLFAIINNAESQDPARLDVTYDETYGVPLLVDIDISEQMADEEIYFTVSDFEVIQ